MPGKTRYDESRTLVRPARRLAGQSPEAFKECVRMLRRHFEQFNRDVADLCQWMIALRPRDKDNTPSPTAPLYEFLLQLGTNAAETENADRARRVVFDLVAGISGGGGAAVPMDAALSGAIKATQQQERTKSAERLFARLATLDPGHRQVLVKAAAEWTVAHYYRAHANYEKHRAAWEEEKAAWEAKHPELTSDLRDKFNQIFRDLHGEQGAEQAKSIRKKNPRICDWEHLKTGKDNCRYNNAKIGKRMHGPTCKLFDDFLTEYKKKESEFSKKNFNENLLEFIEILAKTPRGKSDRALEQYVARDRRKTWFKQAWNAYVKAVGIRNVDNLNRVLHCLNPRGEDCQFNAHTELCKAYKRALHGQPELQAVEGLYREWRKRYLYGPKRPEFHYPSAKTLPMPKIFGRGWFAADFDRSVLRVRLEGMGEDTREWPAIAFKPWPKDYSPQPQETEITSVHLQFHGNHLRIGFRFAVKHRRSRIGMTQDAMDDLRSKVFPRAAQDQLFLDAVRPQLLASFDGPEQDLRILAVDIGTSGGHVAVYRGRKFLCGEPLDVIKLDTLYWIAPKKLEELIKERRKKDENADFPPPTTHRSGRRRTRKKAEKAGQGKDDDPQLGLSLQHVTRHLERRQAQIDRIITKRKEELKRQGQKDSVTLTLRAGDLLNRTRHLNAMHRDWVRLNASQVIRAAEKHKVDLIVFESMRGWYPPGYEQNEQDKKQRLAFWSHGRIRRKTAEKAVERGMRVVTVPYLKSSQHCSQCGKACKDLKVWSKNKNNRKQFICDHEGCGYQADADENAARVLARVFWGEIRLPVEGEHDDD